MGVVEVERLGGSGGGRDGEGMKGLR